MAYVQMIANCDHIYNAIPIKKGQRFPVDEKHVKIWELIGYAGKAPEELPAELPLELTPEPAAEPEQKSPHPKRRRYQRRDLKAEE